LSQQTDLLNRLREEMRQLDIEILTEEAGVSDFKRSTSKHLLALKFGGLLELAEKSTASAQVLIVNSAATHASSTVTDCRRTRQSND